VCDGLGGQAVYRAWQSHENVAVAVWPCYHMNTLGGIGILSWAKHGSQ
jgi:hypothetical protein